MKVVAAVWTVECNINCMVWTLGLVESTDKQRVHSTRSEYVQCTH